ncbi:regakine-1-like isoform X2 [Oreochromis aureus]|uniref:regakine-1-like isoform X2 n=1 Tax=Oreochromis aureus TaxID=47969 RepID=UPI001953E2AC|nr:regakine-1-like isoform X2 [Oreochromis aureus]
MKITQFLLLCILGATLLSAVNCNNANGPDNCCFKLYPGRIKANLIKSYQLTDDRCPKSAVIFITKSLVQYVWMRLPPGPNAS